MALASRCNPICKECGKSFGSNYMPKKNPICPDCKSIDRGNKNLYDAAKKESKFDEAMYRIKKMVKDFPMYENPAKVIHKCLHHEKWFQSTEEIMVGIELIKDKVKVIHQQKIGRYKADFVLPELKTILEVDGKIYHGDKFAEGKRDGLILLTMGLDWHIVRIDTGKINNSIQSLLPAIKAIITKQNESRMRVANKK